MPGFPCLVRHDNNKAHKEKWKDSTFTYSVNLVYGPHTANPTNHIKLISIYGVSTLSKGQTRFYLDFRET